MNALGVVILAAGASSRMGCPKMLLPWKSTSVVGALIEQWSGLRAAQIAIVIAQNDQSIRTELLRICFPQENWIVNPHPIKGMFSSIQTAARWPKWQSAITHWAIALGDQPHLPQSLLAKLISFVDAHPHSICQPSRHGRARHPVFLSRACFEQLKETTQSNLKEYLTAHSADRVLLEIDHPALDLDMDYPADYQRAQEIGNES